MKAVVPSRLLSYGDPYYFRSHLQQLFITFRDRSLCKVDVVNMLESVLGLGCVAGVRLFVKKPTKPLGRTRGHGIVRFRSDLPVAVLRARLLHIGSLEAAFLLDGRQRFNVKLLHACYVKQKKTDAEMKRISAIYYEMPEPTKLRGQEGGAIPQEALDPWSSSQEAVHHPIFSGDREVTKPRHLLRAPSEHFGSLGTVVFGEGAELSTWGGCNEYQYVDVLPDFPVMHEIPSYPYM